MKKISVLIMFLAFLGFQMVQAQTRQITGTVTNSEDGTTLPGVQIIVVSTTIGTITDLDGNYSLTVPETARTLRFSFVGMKTVDVALVGQAIIDVVMESDLLALDEVIVVSYGTATRESFTGAATVVDSETLGKRQVSNVTQALTGISSGVQVSSNTGQPGTSANIRIRGVGSFSASSNPLYIVDGIPFDEVMNSINPNDIENVTILKDAASAALYGARGANGVILITTKKGTKGKLDVNLDVRTGINQRAVPEYDIMTDPAMYYEKYYEGIYNDQYIPGTTTPQEAHEASLALLFGAEGLAYNIYDVPAGGDLIGTDGKINPNASLGRIWANDYWLTNDNWYDELFGKSTTRNEYNLSLAAGGEKQTTFLSVNYLNDQGIISNSGLRRITTRLKTDYDVKKWLQVGMNLGYTNVENKYPQNQEGLSSKNLFWVSRIVAPIYPLYVRGADKQILKDDLGITLYDYGTNEYPGLIRPVMSIANPASDLDLDMQRYDRDFYTMKGFANFFIIDGLKLALNVAYDADISRYTSKSNAYYGQIAEAGGRLTLTDRKRGALTLQQLLTYVKSFGNNNFDLLLGHETFDRQWREMSGFKQNFYDPDSEELSNAILNQTTSSLSDGYFVEGYIARLQYNYNEKYFLSGSFRRDASSRFAPENRWGNFWSVGGSWLLNKEPFLQNVGFIDFLKLKASYGAQGNDSFNNYHPYADQFEVKNSNDDFALEFVYKGNRDITWETSYNLNAGLEFTIINGLFDGSFDFFNRKVVDMLYNIPVPPSAGYDSYPDNLGSMQNTGVEFNLVTNIIRSNNLNWSVFLNGTHYKNEILELPEQWSDPDGYIDGRRIRKIGGSLYDFWYPVYAGVNPETGASQWRITNEDDTYGVTEDYAEASEKKNSASPGTSLPDIQGGFGTTFDAFGFDLSLSCTYALGGLTYDYAYQQLMHAGEAGEAGSNWHKDILNSWTPDNTNTDVPKVDYGSVDQNASSDRFLTKSDYLSFNNVTLGYTLPESILARINIGYLRVYMAADNVLLLSRRKGLDPRQNFNGTTGFIYSPIRTMSIGAKVKF